MVFTLLRITQTSLKKPKGGCLADEQKQCNKELAVERVVIKHMISAFENLLHLVGHVSQPAAKIDLVRELDCQIG